MLVNRSGCNTQLTASLGSTTWPWSGRCGAQVQWIGVVTGKIARMKTSENDVLSKSSGVMRVMGRAVQALYTDHCPAPMDSELSLGLEVGAHLGLWLDQGTVRMVRRREMERVMRVVRMQAWVPVVVAVVVRRGDLLWRRLLVMVVVVMRLLGLLLLLWRYHTSLMMLLLWLRGYVRVWSRLLLHARMLLPDVLRLGEMWRVSSSSTSTSSSSSSSMRMLHTSPHNVILVLLVLPDPGLGALRQLLAFHAPVLEPDLHLALGELQLAGDFPALLARYVGRVEELVL